MFKLEIHLSKFLETFSALPVYVVSMCSLSDNIEDIYISVSVGVAWSLGGIEINHARPYTVQIVNRTYISGKSYEKCGSIAKLRNEDFWSFQILTPENNMYYLYTFNNILFEPVNIMLSKCVTYSISRFDCLCDYLLLIAIQLLILLYLILRTIFIKESVLKCKHIHCGLNHYKFGAGDTIEYNLNYKCTCDDLFYSYIFYSCMIEYTIINGYTLYCLLLYQIFPLNNNTRQRHLTINVIRSIVIYNCTYNIHLPTNSHQNKYIIHSIYYTIQVHLPLGNMCFVLTCNEENVWYLWLYKNNELRCYTTIVLLFSIFMYLLRLFLSQYYQFHLLNLREIFPSLYFSSKFVDFFFFLIDYKHLNIRTYNTSMVHFIPNIPIIILYSCLIETCLWCIVCIPVTVRLVNYICSPLVDLTVTRLMHFLIHTICKQEQNKILLYIKIVKHLEKVAYQVRYNAHNRYNFTCFILFMYNLIINCINISLIAIKFSNKKSCLKLINVNEKLYSIHLYMYLLDSYVQHKTLWDHLDVGHNNYSHTLFNARIYGVITDSEFSNFDKQLLQNKIIYLLICIICVLLYSLVKTMCLAMFILILICNPCIDPYYEKFRLSLEKSSSTLKCNPYITKDYTLYPTNNQIILCPVTGINNHKYDTKRHRDTERKITADQDYQTLSNNTNDSPLNRTDLSALSSIDPDINYLNSNMTYTNTRYFDDEHFRDQFKSNKNISMVHLNIRSIPEHFIELISYIDSLDFVFKIIAISETWLKPYHTDYIIPNYSI